MKLQNQVAIVTGSSSGIGRGVALAFARKGAIVAFARTVALEIGARNVRINSVAPGATKTLILADVPPDLLEQIRRAIPVGRIAEVNACGGPSVIIGLTIDIDDRKRAPLALQESEHQLSLSVWGGAVGLWEWDYVNDHCRWLNDWCRSHEFDECSSPNHHARWRANTHPDDREHVDRIDDEFRADGTDLCEYEIRHRTRHGEWRWLLERGRIAARGADGRATRISGLCIDITVEKENEPKLREYQERYFAVVQRVPGYVFELRPEADGQANVSWASDGLEKVFGVDLKTYRELDGWRRFGFPEDYERNMENRRALLRGESTEQHWHVQNIRGEHRWLNAFYTPFLDASSGKVDMILGVAHDVTERVLLERQVLDATRRRTNRSNWRPRLRWCAKRSVTPDRSPTASHRFAGGAGASDRRCTSHRAGRTGDTALSHRAGRRHERATTQRRNIRAPGPV